LVIYRISVIFAAEKVIDIGIKGLLFVIRQNRKILSARKEIEKHLVFSQNLINFASELGKRRKKDTGSVKQAMIS